MNIFTKQKAIFDGLKALINASTLLTSYNKFFQESVDFDEYLPAILAYVKSDSPVSAEEQTSMGNHSRVFHLMVRILIDPTNTETIETAAENVYSLIYDYGDTSNTILMVQNPSLTYLFEETNNTQVVDLDIPILYKV